METLVHIALLATDTLVQIAPLATDCLVHIAMLAKYTQVQIASIATVTQGLIALLATDTGVQIPSALILMMEDKITQTPFHITSPESEARLPNRLNRKTSANELVK